MDYYGKNGKPILSERQQQILALVGDGYTIQEIADLVGLTHRGTKYHVAQLCRRFGVKRKRELIVIAREYAKDAA